MAAVAFLPSSPIRLHNTRPFNIAAPVHHKPPTRLAVPTCTLTKELAVAAAAIITIGFSSLPLTLPLGPTVTDASTHSYSYSYSCSDPHNSAPKSTPCPSDPHILSDSTHPTDALAVVGVGKSTIHDYHASPVSSISSVSPTVRQRARAITLTQLDEDARREFALAVRLITAVLLGVMLGVERRATALNLGVRSITLLSLSASMLALSVTAADMTGFAVPALASAPGAAVVALAALSGAAVFVAASARKRPPRHVTAMSCTVALDVAMGGACGAGLSLLTVTCYLAAIGVMRGDSSSRRPAARSVRTADFAFAANGKSTLFRKKKKLRKQHRLFSRLNVQHRDGVDGPGLSTRTHRSPSPTT